MQNSTERRHVASGRLTSGESHSTRKLITATLFALWCATIIPVSAATLTGSFAAVPQGANINLTAEGTIDWVHWALDHDTSLNRKADVPARISDFTVIGSAESFLAAYRYADNFNGYTWNDGAPTTGVTNTLTGVWAYGFPGGVVSGAGFQITVPADTTTKTLKVYVGAYAARGRFVATLSDGSATGYTNTSLMNISNGPGGVYTINFAAASAGQSLIIRWTLSMAQAADGNVTLQAATLSAAGSNNPPYVVLTSPANDSTIAAPASLNLEATASDADGTISRVEFFHGPDKWGEDTSGPAYSLTTNGVSPGRYVLTARVTDNLGASRTSPPVEVFVHGTGGSLSATPTFPPSFVDLSTEGPADWSHWGLIDADSYNHHAGVVPQIGDFTPLGTNPVQRFTNNFVAFSWNNGTPVPGEPGSTAGVFATGADGGFELTIPADATSRQLKIYAGLYGAVGRFQAYLSDFSAPAFLDAALDNVFGDSYAVYTIDFAAAAPGQTLTVRYRPKRLYDMDFGNVTLQAAALSGGPTPPPVVVLVNPVMTGGGFQFSFETASGFNYTARFTDVLQPANWQELTNLTGNGSVVTVLDPAATNSSRSYRVEVK